VEKLSRRSFFRLAGGGIAAAIIAPKILLDKIIEIPVEFGWTWHVDKTKIPPSFAEIITKTLRENAPKLRENIEQKNALLVKLKSREVVRLRVERISPEEQTKRMSERLIARTKIRRYEYKPPTRQDEAATFYEGYEDLEKKFLEDDRPYKGSIPHIRAV
jgi:hypothetical protein